MEKVSVQNSPPNQFRIITPSVKVSKFPNNLFSSINGELSFSKTPILKNIKISGLLKEDGTLLIYIRKDGFNNDFSEVKKNLHYNYGAGFTLFQDTVFFKGSFMEGFDFNNLSENISTYIINGDMVSFNKGKRASSIGKLKRIEDVLHLNSSLKISSIVDKLTNTKKHSNHSFLGIDITMQFKKGAA